MINRNLTTGLLLSSTVGLVSIAYLTGVCALLYVGISNWDAVEATGESAWDEVVDVLGELDDATSPPEESEVTAKKPPSVHGVSHKPGTSKKQRWRRQYGAGSTFDLERIDSLEGACLYERGETLLPVVADGRARLVAMDAGEGFIDGDWTKPAGVDDCPEIFRGQRLLTFHEPLWTLRAWLYLKQTFGGFSSPGASR